MAFDIQAARSEGYSDAEIATHLSRQHNFKLGDARAAGFGDAEVIEFLAARPLPRAVTPTPPATDQPIAPAPEKSLARRAVERVSDVGLDLAQGVVGAGESVVGVADLLTGNKAGEALGAIGYDPARTKQIIASGYSDARQAENARVHAAEGFVDTTAAMLENPATALGAIVESAPLMLGSAAAVRAAAGQLLTRAGIAPGTRAAAEFLKRPEIAARLATVGSAAEGATAAGSIQEQARQQGRTWSESAPYAAAGGAGTAVIGKAASKLLPDVDVAAGTMGLGAGERITAAQAAKQVGRGAVQEGFVEELPQSAQEQVAQNLATGRPWDEGVGAAAAQGLVAGVGMGAGATGARAARDLRAPVTDATSGLRFDPAAIEAAARAALDPARAQIERIEPVLQQREAEAAQRDPLEGAVAGLESDAIRATLAARLDAVETEIRRREAERFGTEAGAIDQAELLDQARTAPEAIRSEANPLPDLPPASASNPMPELPPPPPPVIDPAQRAEPQRPNIPQATPGTGWGTPTAQGAAIDQQPADLSSTIARTEPPVVPAEVIPPAPEQAEQPDQATPGVAPVDPDEIDARRRSVTRQMESLERTAQARADSGDATGLPSYGASHVEGRVSAVDWMTQAEREEFEALRQQLPTPGEEVEAAKIRVARKQAERAAAAAATALNTVPIVPQWRVIRADGRTFGKYRDQRDAEGALSRAGAGATVERINPEQVTAAPTSSVAPLLMANGQPFRSEKLAASSARQRRLDLVPVEVPGGWGLVPRTAAATSAPSVPSAAPIAAPEAAPVEQTPAAPAPTVPAATPVPRRRASRQPDGRAALLQTIEQAKASTGDPTAIAEYADLQRRIIEARRVARLKKTKRAEAHKLTTWADNAEQDLEKLRERIGYVRFTSGTSRYKVLNAPEHLEAFAKKVRSTAAFRTAPADWSTVYDHIEVRPGSTEAQLETGRSALRDLWRRIEAHTLRGRQHPENRPAITVLGSGLYAGFTESGGVKLTGQRVENPHDLAVLAQVFRDPRFETFRVFYTDDQGVIIGEAGYSSRLPAAVYLPNIVGDIQRDAAAYKAAGYHILHNHPSGRSAPSSADLQLTKQVAAAVPGFRGHVVIDHNEYSTIDEFGNADTIPAPELAGIDFHSRPELEHRLLGTSISSPTQVVALAKALQVEGGHATMVFTRRGGEVQLIVDLPAALLGDDSKVGIARLKGVVRRAARAVGAGGHRFVVVPDGAMLDALEFQALVTQGVFTDVVAPDGRSMRDEGARWPGDFLDSNIKPAARVAEDGPYNYEAEHLETAEQYGGRDAWEAARAAGATKLGYRQWVTVRTPAFKRWFGDWENGQQAAGSATDPRISDGATGRPDAQTAPAASGFTGAGADDRGGRRVDPVTLDPDTGEPRVFFHGTGDDVEAFDFAHPRRKDAGWLGRGAYVTTDDFIAETYARIKTPGDAGPNVMAVFVRSAAAYPATLEDKQKLSRVSQTTVDEVTRRMRAAGFDAAQLTFADGTVELATFAPENIKSAIGNAGAFDPLDASIIAEPGSEYDAQNGKRPDQTGRATFAQRPIPPDQGAKGNVPRVEQQGRPYPSAPPASWAEPNVERWRNLIYRAQDKFIDLKRVVAAIRASGQTIDDAFDPYLQEELHTGRAAHRVQAFAEREVEPIMQRLKSYGIEIADFEEYLHARHAPERNAAMMRANPNQAELDARIAAAQAEIAQLEAQRQAQGRTGDDARLAAKRAELRALQLAQPWQGTEEDRRRLSGLSDDEAQAIRDRIENGPKAAVFKRLAERIDQISRDTRADMVVYGLETQSTIDAMGAAYQHYVPLHREMDTDAADGAGTGHGLSVRSSKIKRATGSTRTVEHILANLFAQREQVLNRGEKNRFGEALYGLALQAPNPDFWAVIRPGISQRGLRAELQAMGLDPVLIDAMVNRPTEPRINERTGIVEHRVNPAFAHLEHVISLRVGGEDRMLILNPNNPQALRLARAIKNADSEIGHHAVAGEALRLIGKGTRFLAAINTQYSPAFVINNFVRDLQGAALNLSSTAIAGRQLEVLRQVPAALAGIRDALRGTGRTPWAQTFAEFAGEGGRTAFQASYDSMADRAEQLARLVNPKWTDRVARSRILAWISDTNTVIENGVRLAAFKVARDAGLSPQQAASLAKNLTVNFNRKGSMTATVSPLYAFANASVQGTARTWATLSGPAGRKILAGGVALGVVQVLAGMLAMGGDEWDEIPDFEKQRNLIIPLGRHEGDDVAGVPGARYLKIPMPLGLNILPHIGRSLTEIALYQDRLGDRLTGLVFGIVDNVNPLGSSDPRMAVVPTVARPVFELMRNQNFAGNPIAKTETSALDPTPGFTRNFRSASAPGKLIAQGFNAATGGDDFAPGRFSPTGDQVDYVFGTLTGGVGRDAMKAANLAMDLAAREPLTGRNLPIVGGWYGRTNSETQLRRQYFEAVEAVNVAENKLQGLARNGRATEADTWLKAHPEAGLARAVRRTQAHIGDLNKRAANESGDAKRATEAEAMAAMATMLETIRRMQDEATAR